MTWLISPRGVVVEVSEKNTRRMIAAGYSPIVDNPKATKAAKTGTRSRTRKTKGA